MELITIARLDQWLSERLRTLRCGDDTRAYVVGVLQRFQRDAGSLDMSRESVVLAFHEARLRGDFAGFQRIGDWTLWVSSVQPTQDRAQREVIETFGRLSYYSCHRLMRGQWRLYEELADELPVIVYDVRCNLRPDRGIMVP